MSSAFGGSPPARRSTMDRRRSAAEESKDLGGEKYGPGWTQITDQGKMYLSKKEQNVFILEGTGNAGFSACGYGGNPEELELLHNGAFSLVSEVKAVPGDQCTNQQIYILVDLLAAADLSSGCDFCAVKLDFAARQVKIESQRKNATQQTLFVLQNCAVLRSGTYLTIRVDVADGAMTLLLNGVVIISHLPLGRTRSGSGFSEKLGIGVYGKTRCYLRRFKVIKHVEEPAEKASGSAADFQARGSTSIVPYAAPAPVDHHRSSSVGRRQPDAMCSVPGFPVGDFSEEIEMTTMIERDIVVHSLDVSFDDIGGLADAKRAMNEAVILPLLIPEFFTGLRKPWKGVLLFGPPGTGKTMLAKAAASMADNVTFFNCSVATLTSKWRGESEKLLRALFTVARAKSPSILFFDEMDSLLGQRGSSAEHEASRRFKSEFLIHVDGLLSDHQAQNQQVGHMLVLATSNAPWDLDEALRRRLEKRIYIPLPDQAARRVMFEGNLKDINVSPDLNLDDLAARTEHYSGADVHLICRDASMNPLRRLVDGLSPLEVVELKNSGKLTPGAVPVEMADFESALANIQPSVSDTDIQRFEQWFDEFGSK